MDEICMCGHQRCDHIYEMDACRPGYKCEVNCQEFTPRASNGLTKGQASAPFEEMSQRKLAVLLQVEMARADSLERRVQELENTLHGLDL